MQALQASSMLSDTNMGSPVSLSRMRSRRV